MSAKRVNAELEFNLHQRVLLVQHPYIRIATDIEEYTWEQNVHYIYLYRISEYYVFYWEDIDYSLDAAAISYRFQKK